MTAKRSSTPLSWRIYALGVTAVGLTSLIFGDFDPGQPVPKNLPFRIPLAYAAGAFLVLAAAAVQWRRTAAWGAAALTLYYAFFVVVLMNGRLLLLHYAQFVTYENIAMQLAIAAAGLIVYAAAAARDAAQSARLTRLGRLSFGVCTLVFGGAHFVYLNLTAPLVPQWLPPSQPFWAYATGTGFVMAGIAILTGVQARLAAILLTFMLASFAVLVHAPSLLARPSSHWNWTEGAENLAVTGAAWVVSHSLARPRRKVIAAGAGLNTNLVDK